MTDTARKIFYVNKPAIETKASFSKSCPNGSREQTIVLGCYQSNQQGIFLLDVTDPRLNGVEQVTAAHEMLHAAYDRLSESEKQRVDAMLMSYYKTGLTDERVKTTIDAYKDTEPDDLVNEMHSIFGTEIAILPADLEQYYKHYFTIRGKVVGYAEKYQAEFSSRKAVIDKFDKQLQSLNEQIDEAKSQLSAVQSQIDSQREKLISLREEGSVNEYNAGVPVYNNLVNRYNDDVANLRNMIAKYNSIVAERNTIAQEEDDLTKALDSNSLEQKSQTINQ